MKLSVAMIVKNEEKNIERCLKAIKKLDNKISYEIIIVDTGSTDKTIEISQKYTDKVYKHPWNGNFSDMRNISINYCKGEWILILDADEVLENPERLVEFLTSSKEKKYNAAEIIIKNLLGADINNYITVNLFRLFKRNKEFYYEGRIHEQPRVLVPYTNSRVSVLHYGYSREDYEVMKYKYERNKALLEEDLKNGADPIYTRFQLAQTYAMANESLKALMVIKEAYELEKSRVDGKRSIDVYHFYSRELVNFSNYESAIKVAKEGIEYCKSSLDFFYVLSFCYKELKKYDEAIKNFEIYFNMYNKKKKGILVHEDEKKYGSLVDYSYAKYDEVLINYVTCFYEQKDYNRVILEFRKIKNKKAIKSLELIYIYSLFMCKMFGEIKKHFSYKLEEEDIEKIMNIIEKVETDNEDFNINDSIKELYGIDKRIDICLRCIYLDENINKLNFKFNGFFTWKAKILRNLLPRNRELINLIKLCSNKDIDKYISYINNNYECLKILYDYSQNKFLTLDLNELAFVNIVERNIIFNSSVNGKKYKNLIIRAMINNVNYINYVYNKGIIKSSNYYKILDSYGSLWYGMLLLIKDYNNDKVKYLQGLRKLLNMYPEYKDIIKEFMNEINDDVISDEMIKEKDNLLKVCNEYINNDKLLEASEILNELNDIFKYDGDILLTKGVLNYLNGDNKGALLNLSLALELINDQFDCVYNIACVLEADNNKEIAKYYYEESYRLCNDENLKIEINDILNYLNKGSDIKI
ncbi:glycosyltransferase [Clostridium sp. HCP1S3_B4]|uniref:glycosyltransferase n=1 Tax=unclassified Clostridium TaxID=2614128 RepID=UPI003F8B4F87